MISKTELVNYKPKYTDWTESDYINSNLRYCEPMTAHALEDESEQDSLLNDPEYLIEEKFDGTRGILHFLDNGCRVFSRRISKKTNWFTENSDSLPQMRDLVIPELSGTVIDGEMFIPDRPFKDVSSTLNCKWDKAIDRQREIGDIVFHAFDILYYNGTRVERLSLKRRKAFLRKVFEVLNHYNVTCIEEVKYYPCVTDKDSKGAGNLYIPAKNFSCNALLKMSGVQKYKTLYAELKENSVGECRPLLSPRGYYEFIVATGGEGVIIKDLRGKYEHKRSRGFLKIKKFYTREVIISGFTEPTKYYDGKFPDDSWEYWETESEIYADNMSQFSARELLSKGYKPITKHFFNKWVGNIVFSVIITPDEIENLPKDKKFNVFETIIDGVQLTLIEVGECSGFDEDIRKNLSDNDIGRVIEVKCNEIFKDTGKLRHPRFLRFREDKDPTECTYINHITE